MGRTNREGVALLREPWRFARNAGGLRCAQNHEQMQMRRCRDYSGCDFTGSAEAMTTVLALRNSRMPAAESSRPAPERLMPPKGRRGSLATMVLRKTPPH